MSSYDLLRREIREFIFDEGWESLRSIQEGAIKYAHNTQNNLILAAPTASGKTEAAFLPAINSVKDFKQGVKIVYVSPLIALINDQFKRINDLCNYMNIQVTSWHSEASQTAKKKLVKDPEGILLITPESIEAMLTLRPEEAKHLFKDVEWVIVDEIHGFLDNNRGIQLRSLLERMQKLMLRPPRYIGMSATLNRDDYKNIKNFFISDNDTSVLLDNSKNKLVVTNSYYGENSVDEVDNALEEIYHLSEHESMLVFPNSRTEVERISVALNKLGKKRYSNTRYFAHHSSVSKEQRLSAENFAKNASNELFTIICTSTLELGIDIGAVDSIVQYNAPYSVASLGQRLGRSGRKSQENILHFIATDDYSLLQGLAAISLYKQGKIDRFVPIIKPYDVLAHQVLSILREKYGVKISELKKINQTNLVFSDISDREVSLLLNYMLHEGYIEVIGDEVIVGRSSERLFAAADFYTHFETESRFSVYNDQHMIGEIPVHHSVQVGANIFLSGKVWKITQVQTASQKVFVLKANDGKPPEFFGDKGLITNEIRLEMRHILENKELWSQYDEKIISALIRMANDIEYDERYLFVHKEDEYGLRTFQGTKINDTLLLLLNMLDYETVYKLSDKDSFIFGKNIELALDEIRIQNFTEDNIKDYLSNYPHLVELFLDKNKYRELLPDDLRIDYIINNCLDLKGTLKYLNIDTKVRLLN